MLGEERLLRRVLCAILALGLGSLAVGQARRALRSMQVEEARSALERAREGRANALEIASATASAREAWQEDRCEAEAAEVLAELLLWRLGKGTSSVDMAEARRVLGDLQRARPTSARARARAAHLELYFGDRERGERLLEQALELAPHERPLWAWAAEDAFEQALATGEPRWKERAVERWAEVNRGAGDRLEESLAKLSLLDDRPTYLQRAVPGTYAGLLALGEQLWSLGHLAEAADALRRASAREPWRSWVWFALGRVELEADRPAQASEAFWQALGVERRDRPRLLARVMGACFDHRAFGLQLELVERAVERWPTLPDLDIALARASLDAGEVHAARSILQRRSRPWSDPEVAFLLATAERRLGDAGAALEIATRALEAAPRDPRLEALLTELER